MSDENELGVRITADTAETSKVSDALNNLSSDMERTTSKFRTFTEAQKSAIHDMSVDTANASRSLTSALQDASEKSSTAMSRLNFATAGVTREIIVLAHEAMSGNFSRMPGSVMVLAERMGGLSLSTLGAGAAIGATGYALYEMASHAERAAENINHIQVALEAQGRSQIAADTLESYIEKLSKLHGINTEAAESITNTLATAANISQTAFSQLTSVVADYAAVTGTAAPKAAQELVRMSEDPMRAAQRLSETYRGILSPAQYDQIQQYTQMGDKMSAMDVLAEALATRFKGLQEKGLTPAQEGATMLGNTLSWLWEKMAPHPVEHLEKALGYLARAFRDTAKAEKESKEASDAEVKKQTEAAMNNVVLDGLKLRDKIINTLDEEGKLRKELQTIVNATTNAEILGETEEAKKLRETGALIQAKIDKLETQKRKQAEAEQHRVTQEKDTGLAETQRVEEQKFRTVAEGIKLQADQKKISLQQEFVTLSAERTAEWAEDQKLYQKRMALWQQGSAGWKKVKSEMSVAEQKFQQDILGLEKQRIQKEKQLRQQETQEWKGSIKSITSSFSSGVKGMIKGQQTLLQAAQGVASGMLDAFLGYFERKASLYIIDQILGDASAVTQGLAEIKVDSAVAGAAAYASTCAIPVVGPGLAPAAATAAKAATLAFGSDIAKFDVGTNRVPNDMLAMIHKDEAVIPAYDAEQMRSGKNQDTLPPVIFNIKAYDSKDVNRLFARHGDAIADQVMRAYRNNRGISTRGH